MSAGKSRAAIDGDCMIAGAALRRWPPLQPLIIACRLSATGKHPGTAVT